MTLREWQESGWLVAHESSPQEIADLLAVVDRDLTDATTAGLSADWRLNIAYNAALQAATAALAAAGYRTSREAHHYRVIQSLRFTIEPEPSLIAQFNQFRKKRNIGGYERAGVVSDQEAEALLELACRLKENVSRWIHESHPHLIRTR